MKYFLILLIGFLSSCKETTPIKPDLPVTKERDPNTIIVALEQDVEWGHYQFMRKGQHQGLEIELLQHIAANSEYTFEFKILPWKRAMQEVKDAETDILISVTTSPKRALDYVFSDTLYEVNQVLYYKKTHFPDGISFSSQHEIEQYSTGSILGYNIDQLKFKITEDRYRKINRLFKAVENDSIDFAVGYLELDRFNNHQTKQFGHLFIPAHPPLTCHWAIGRENPRRDELLSFLNQEIKKLQVSGQYEELEQKYLLQ